MDIFTSDRTTQDTNLGEEIAGSLTVEFPPESSIREKLASVLKGCKKSRTEIAEELSRLTHCTVTERMLNDWCSPSRRCLRFPLRYVRALCQITGNDDLAFLAMRDSLREQAKLGARAVELLPLLRNMVEQASALAGRPRAMRSKRSK